VGRIHRADPICLALSHRFHVGLGCHSGPPVGHLSLCALLPIGRLSPQIPCRARVRMHLQMEFTDAAPVSSTSICRHCTQASAACVHATKTALSPPALSCRLALPHGTLTTAAAPLRCRDATDSRSPQSRAQHAYYSFWRHSKANRRLGCHLAA
jgi:hypothetical protein